MYNQTFSLNGRLGNNAFSYELRGNKTLFVSSIIDGNFRDVKEWSEIVFEDIDEKGVLRSCTGLRNFVRMDWKGIPMIVFDNHNHALYFWYEALSRGDIGQKNTLVHIDEHSDLWANDNNIEKSPQTPLNKGGTDTPRAPRERGGGIIELKNIFEFTNYQCNVGNYIQPAIRSGIIETVLRIEDTIGMEKYASYEKWKDESMILNLDLDFFAPELDYIPFEDKKRTILHFARQSDLITIATSPFFIDQKRAIEMFGRVFEL